MGQKNSLPSWSRGSSSGGGSNTLPSWAGGSSAPKPKKSSGSHGFFHRLGSDLYNTAVHSPSGIYEVGKAVVNPVVQDIKHGPTSPQAKKARGEQTQIVKATGQAFAEDAKHPLRHPGNTLLDAASLASLGAGTAARAAEAGRVARAGESAADVTKALVKGPKPEPRVIDLGERGTVDRGYYSRSASTRGLQKTVDRLQSRYPNVRFGLRNLPQKVGAERATNQRIRDRLANAPAHQLIAQARKLKLKNDQRLALRVVAEGVPLKARITDTEKFLAESSGRAKRLLENHLTLLKRTQRYVHDVKGSDGRLVPRFRSTEHDLIGLYQHAHSVASKREADLIEAGYLTKESAQARKDAPGNLHYTGSTKPLGVERNGQLALLNEAGFNPDVMPELFHNKEGFYVSYRYAKSPKSLGKGTQLGIRNQVGIPRTDSELTHAYTGAANEAGLVHPDTPRLVAEGLLRSNRLLSLWRQRGELEQLSKPAVTDPKYDIPIRPVWLAHKQWPAEVRAYIDELDKGTIPEDEHLPLLQRIFDFVFPTNEHPATHVGLEVPGIQWIDKRELGKLNLPGPLVGIGQHPGFANTLKTVDAINNAERLAILYLKPAYAVPNLLGNVALNLVQQGVFAPANLAKAARLNSRLGDEAAARLDAVMGEGVVRSLGNADNIGHRVIDKAARFWEGKVDTPFRRAAFLHEARRAGFKNGEQVARLLTDPNLEDTLIRVAREANSAIIDYGRLGPVEKDIVRRVVFFYPWIKGATIYGGRFLADHPNQAALLGEEGKQGAEIDAHELGPLPSYAEGVFKVGERGGNPLVVNPSSAGVLQTPADVAKSIVELTSGHPGQAFEANQYLSPVFQALLAATSSADRKRGQSAVTGIKDQLVNQLPLVTTLQGLRKPPSRNAKKMYPRNRQDVILKYLIGGLAPTPLNPNAAQSAAAREKSGR